MAAPLIVITGATHGMGRIAEIILFCYKLPQSICIRDLVVMPTTSGY
ncbi:MAG: hypothetical protein WCD67_11400 [Xanthobacteraceae bacterium]